MRRTLALSLATALCTIGLADAVAGPPTKLAVVVDPNVQRPNWRSPKNAPDLRADGSSIA